MRIACIGVIAAGALAGCVQMMTVQHRLNDGVFQAENQPVRTVRVGVLTDGARAPEEVHSVVREASMRSEEQFGIRFEVVSIGSIRFMSRDKAGMLHELFGSAGTAPEADIVLGVTAFEPSESRPGVEQEIGFNGVIDGVYWRYIVVKNLRADTVLHEFIHAMTASPRHSDWGIMAERWAEILPGVSLRNNMYATEEERASILRNKWTDFHLRQPRAD
jgi:hypothetical protein